MKRKLIGLSQRYATALRKYLEQGAHAGFRPAMRLGRQAVALGLETLEVARIHERALASLDVSWSNNGPGKRAGIFFTEVIAPIVETHRAALQGKTDLKRPNEAMGQRIEKLGPSNRQLQRGIVRRKSVEAALKKRVKYYTRRLKESLQLQEGLRHLTHRNLSTQERDRRTISHQLQDEIAQSLLGIHVRLLTLRTAAKGNTTNLEKEIASTQRLVEESVQSINRFARELNIHR